MRQKVSDDLLRMNLSGRAGTTDSVLEAQVRLNQKDVLLRGGNNGPSFRDVVAEFAREQDLLFQPRLNNGTSSSYSTTTKDGKPIYLFGSIPMYLDHNVAYAYTKATTATTIPASTTTNRVWQPMSLQEIAVLAKQNISEHVES